MIKLIKEVNQLDNSQQIYFLSLIEESFLLLEGIKSAKEKYLDEIGEDKFNELVEIDPSRNKKYLDWICREYLNNVDLERLRSDIKLFDEKCNKNLIQNKDIYSYDNIDELENILNETPDISNTERKREIKKNPNKEEIEILPDVKVLRNDDEYFIAEIHSWEDAKFYGKGTKWCIAEKGNNGYWKKYYEKDKDKFIYVRDFSYPDLGMNSDLYYKLIIQVPFICINDKDKIDYSKQKCIIWDAKDNEYNLNIQKISDMFKLNSKDINNALKIDFNTKEGVEEWLDIMDVEDYTINNDLTIDINGNVNLSNKKLTEIPVQFGEVTGDFYCNDNKLESLEGSPEYVGGDFHCSSNPKLKSLKGAPKIVNGSFYCSNNLNLESLEGAPKEVKDFYCNNNPNLKSLEGAPKTVNGDFYCENNPNLESLKGAPKKVGRDFNCSSNLNLESLKDVPKIVKGNFNCSDNLNLESLEWHPKYVGRDFYCSYNPKLSKGYLDNFDFSFVNGDVYYD